jgi:FkbM family methyltransferase
MADEMDTFLSETNDSKQFLDIGALHGIFSLAFAARSPDRRVLAIDASPVAFARMLYNIHANKLENIKAVECAVSGGAGKLRMHYEWEHAVAAGTTDKGVIEVAANSADNICEENTFSPDAIKIDVEGHEIKVLKGLTRTIRQSNPIIFLEVHPSRILQEGDSISEIESIFSQLGYTATRLDGRPFQLSSLTQQVADERLVLRPKSE